LLYRKELSAPFPTRAQPAARLHPFLTFKSLAAAAAMIGFFFAGANVSMVAFAAGAALLLTRRVKPEKVFLEINWNLLTLFAGLFVVVGAARSAGVTDALFDLLHAREARSVGALSAAAAVLSNLVSNVPAVMLLSPLVPQLPDPHRAWLTLAMASTLAGNLTVVGSIANLIVVEGARGVCPIGFREYLKLGLPVTVLTLAAGVALMR
jgi:Na+/H+ antiporter NhaD/arsenite permease-like protein